MSIYYTIYSGTTDTGVNSTSGTYSDARSSTAATNATTTTSSIRNANFSGTYHCGQAFLDFDTSGISGSVSSAKLFLWNDTVANNTDSDSLVFRVASSLANKVAGASLSSLTLLGTGSWGTGAAERLERPLSSPGNLPISASAKVLVHSQNEQDNITPTGQTACGFSLADTAGTTNDPYLLVVTGSPWTYVGTSASVTEVASGNITPTEPAGVASGDLLVACIAYRDSAAFTLPADWTLVASQESSGNTTTNNSAIGSGLMAYIVRGASAPSFTFTRTGGNVALARVYAYRGVDQTTPYITGQSRTQPTAESNVSTNSLTTTSDDALVVFMVAGGQEGTVSNFRTETNLTIASSGTGSNSTAAPAPNMFQERSDDQTTTGADTLLAVADAVATIAGLTGAPRADHTNTNVRHVGISAAFKLATPVAAVPTLVWNPNHQYLPILVR